MHLNLAEGSPILSDSVNSILCSDDINGHFNMKCPLGDARLLAHHFLDMKSIIAIRKEIIAQMELFRSAGFMSDYIDSHCWSHMEFPVLIALLPIMKKYGFATIRSSWGLIDHYALGSKLNLYWKFVSKFYKGRVSETWSGLGQDYIDEYEKLELKDKRCEIYCHPDILEDKLIDTKFDRSYRHVYMTEYKQSILAGLGEV